MIARFGNEAFEMSTSSDRAAVLAAYDATDDETVLLAANGFLPWGDRFRDSNTFLLLEAEPTTAWLDEVRASAEADGSDRVLIVFTASQSAYLEHAESQPSESLDQIGRWLSNQTGVDVLFQQDGAWVFEVEV